jgi:phosphopentomutase
VIAGRRAFVIVLDACGAGALPDADEYGDAGTNTLRHVGEAEGGLDLPTLARLGLGNVTEVPGVASVPDPAVHGRLAPLGHGKDTTTGHWELMGVAAPHAPVYPQGFPPEVIDEFTAATGRAILCNEPREGLRALEEFGPEHLETGALILYTSQDSVFQLAAHVDVVPEEELYRHCAAARAILTDEHAVGRVIARPFDGGQGAFERTPGRRDFALDPPARTYLDELADHGGEVHAVGKVGQVFNGRGISAAYSAPDNALGIEVTERLMGELSEGLVFTNLVDTDQVFGHRKDTAGFHAALREIDAAVAAGRLLWRVGPLRRAATPDRGRAGRCGHRRPGRSARARRGDHVRRRAAAALSHGRRCVTATPCSSATRAAISERWHASGSRSTQKSAPRPSAGSASTTVSTPVGSRISLV